MHHYFFLRNIGSLGKSYDFKKLHSVYNLIKLTTMIKYKNTVFDKTHKQNF